MILKFYWSFMAPGHALAAWIISVLAIIIIGCACYFILEHNRLRVKIAAYKAVERSVIDATENYGHGKNRPDWVKPMYWYE